MKRVAVFQNDLSVGGIQKSLINLLRNIDYNRFSVDLYLFAENTFWNVEFPSELHVKHLHPVSKIYSFVPFNIAKSLIRPDFGKCEEYDVAIDFNSYQNSCAVGAIKVPAKKRVMWIHNDVEIKLQNEWKYRLLWSLFKAKFAYYDEFVGVSQGLIQPFQKMSGVTDKKFRAIQNYIDTAEIARKVLEEPKDFKIDPNCFNLVGLGRLCHQKAYDIMLDIFGPRICPTGRFAFVYYWRRARPGNAARENQDPCPHRQGISAWKQIQSFLLHGEDGRIYLHLPAMKDSL